MRSAPGCMGLRKASGTISTSTTNSGRDSHVQLDNEAYYDEIVRLAGKRYISGIIIDPSIGTFNLQVDNLFVKTRVTRLEALQVQRRRCSTRSSGI